MSFHIDPQFSVWRLVTKVRTSSTRLNHRVTMNVISNEIEDVTLLDSERTRIFSGFQRMSKFLPQLERYRRMAQSAECIYVFGIPDVALPEIPGIVYVELKPEHQLAREWFLVSSGPGYASALVTEEVTSIDTEDSLRVFNGLWTFDANIIEVLDEWLCNIVNMQGELQPAHHDNDHQIRIMNNTVNRLLLKATRSRYNKVVQGEIKSIIKNGIYPDILRLSGIAADTLPDGYEQDAVILFSDLRNFSSIAETMNARDLVERIINPYLSTVSKVIYERGGVVDKFLGDGVLAVFGLQSDMDSAEDRAVTAAHEILAELSRVLPLPPVGIGIARGKVMVGQIGSSVRSELTVIGDAVNTAQRLSQYGNNDAWLSYTVYDRLAKRSNIEACGAVELKGKAQPHQVYRLHA